MTPLGTVEANSWTAPTRRPRALIRSAWRKRPNLSDAASAHPSGCRPTMHPRPSRLLDQRLSERLGQPFIIENRAGVAGNIGIEPAAEPLKRDFRNAKPGSGQGRLIGWRRHDGMTVDSVGRRITRRGIHANCAGRAHPERGSFATTRNSGKIAATASAGESRCTRQFIDTCATCVSEAQLCSRSRRRLRPR
jgi:hypothetical protein